MARRKQAALVVPASQSEAIALLAEYRAAERRALELRLGYELQIDKSKTERDQVLALIAADQAPRFAALKAWWEAGGKELAGKRRSAELAGATLGIRLTPPAVKFAKGINAARIVDWLGRVVGGTAFLRTKVELDKPAIIKVLSEDGPMAEALSDQGVTVIQTDEFFIDTQLDEGKIRNDLGHTELAPPTTSPQEN